MRDLTKSVTSYTWALSVFGAQQMVNLLGLGGSGSWQRSTKAFTNVTEATTQELGDTMRAVFRSGDALQRGFVDLVLAPFGNGSTNGAASGAARGSGGNGAYGSTGFGGPTGGSPYGAGGNGGDAWSSGPAPGPAPGPGAGPMPGQPPAGSAPPSSDPSLGWGPMPR